jgi:GT2 family glycosyltransferase
MNKEARSSSAAQGCPRTYIVILNWNNWADTIECLESVFRNEYKNYRVVVCDNGSSDGSLDHIRAWADGSLSSRPSSPAMAAFSSPALPKPIAYSEFNGCFPEYQDVATPDETKLVLLQTGANLGFAGGNNAGLRYAMQDPAMAYVWLLNNDVVIEPDALTRLVSRMREQSGSGRPGGMCGSTLLYYHRPEMAQVLGGSSYNKWRCRAMPIGMGRHSANDIDRQSVEEQLGYIAGASMLISRDFLESVGLMHEGYFLYYEEIDWSMRARDRYALLYAPDSIVYHKEGGTIGTASIARPSALSIFYMQRSRMLFMKKFFKWQLAYFYGIVIGELLTAVMRRDFYTTRWKLAGTLGRVPGRFKP